MNLLILLALGICLISTILIFSNKIKYFEIRISEDMTSEQVQKINKSDVWIKSNEIIGNQYNSSGEYTLVNHKQELLSDPFDFLLPTLFDRYLIYSLNKKIGIIEIESETK